MPHKTNHFFNVEIGMIEATLVKSLEDGTERLKYHVEFNAECVNIIAEALRKTGGLVPSSSGTRVVLTSSPKVRVGAKALIRLEATMHTMKNYEMVNHKLTSRRTSSSNLMPSKSTRKKKLQLHKSVRS